MTTNDIMELLLTALQFWVKKEKENSLSGQGLELLQADIDISFHYLNKTSDSKGHSDDCCVLPASFQSKSNDVCTSPKLNFALFRLKNLNEFYK